MEKALNIYSSTFKQVVLPFLKKRSARSYIGFAILLIAVQQTYSLLRVPKKLRQFPSVSVFSMIKSFYYNESVIDRNRRLVTPLMKAGHKFYVSRVPLTWTIFIIDPVAAKTLLLKTENFPKSNAIFKAVAHDSPAMQFFGIDNVAISNGETWKKQRRIMNPAFHRAMPVKTMSSVVPDLFSFIEKEFSSSSNDEVIVPTAMKNFTLDVLGLTVFGFDFQSLKGDPEGWTRTYDMIVSSLFNPWINIFAKLDFIAKYISAERRRTIEATTTFNTMLDNLIDKKRQELIDAGGINNNIPENEKDLLTLMLEADIRDVESNEESTTTEELRHNVAIFFLAGHDTTANTLSFCLYHLAKNKHIQRKARAEIINIFGDDKCDVYPTVEELKQLDYVNMIIKENLRINAPADTLITRTAVEDIDLAGTIITKGTDISVDIAAIQLNPDLWQNPEQFIPERFEQGGEQESHTGLSWIPFSNGGRQCIGMQFSLTEQRLVLVALLRKYEIDISKDSIHYDHVVHDTPANLAPKSLKLKFTKRY